MPDLIINVTPGVGKTHSAMEEVGSLASKKRVLFTTQTGKNIEELGQLAQRLCPGIEIRIIRGRSGGTPENIKPGKQHPDDANCYNYDEVEKAAGQGFSPGLVVCSTCSHDDLCPYKVQFKKMPKKGLIIAAHESASTLPVKPDVWVIDESCVKAFLKSKSLSPDAFTNIKCRLPNDSASVLEQFQDTAEKALREIRNYSDRSVARLYATQPAAEWQGKPTLWDEAGVKEIKKKLSRDLGIFEQFEGESMPKYHRRLYHEEQINFYALKWLRIALGEERGVAYIQIKKDRNKPITYVLFYNTVPKYATG